MKKRRYLLFRFNFTLKTSKWFKILIIILGYIYAYVLKIASKRLLNFNVKLKQSNKNSLFHDSFLFIITF